MWASVIYFVQAFLLTRDSSAVSGLSFLEEGQFSKVYKVKYTNRYIKLTVQ